MKNQPTEVDTDHDEYLEIVYQQWGNIFRLYMEFEDKRPVMLFDNQEQRIYAYPYEDFRTELSARSQISLTEQYEKAKQSMTVVVFVRDNQKRKLVSYSIPFGENRRKTKGKKEPKSTGRSTS